MTKKILSEIFATSKDTKSLIGLYEKNNQIDDFSVGYVIDFDESIVVIQHVTKYGVKDGIHVKEIVVLDKNETDSEYLKCCQLLFENQELLPKQITETVRFSFADSWQYHFLNDNSCIGELIAFDLRGEDYFNFGFLSISMKRTWSFIWWGSRAKARERMFTTWPIFPPLDWIPSNAGNVKPCTARGRHSGDLKCVSLHYSTHLPNLIWLSC